MTNNINLINLLNKLEGRVLNPDMVPWLVLAREGRQIEEYIAIETDSIKNMEERLKNAKQELENAKENKQEILKALNKLMETSSNEVSFEERMLQEDGE